MAFKVGPNSKNPPLTRDGIPYLYGTHKYVDSAPDPASAKWYNDDSIYGGYNYDEFDSDRDAGFALFGRSLVTQDGIVVVGAPRANDSGKYRPGMAVILDCPIYDSVGNNSIVRISHPDLASIPAGGRTAGSFGNTDDTILDGVSNPLDLFGARIAIDDNKIAISAPGTIIGSTAAGKAWLFKTDGTLISQLDPNSNGFGVEIGKTDSAYSYGFGLEMDAGRVVVHAPDFADSANSGYKGVMSLFDYSGNIVNQTKGISIPSKYLYNGIMYWNEYSAMGDGMILTSGKGHYVHVFDYDGNYKRSIDISIYNTLYPDDPTDINFGGVWIEDIGIGCGRIVLKVRTGPAFGDWSLFILDYNFNLIKKYIDPDTVSGVRHDRTVIKNGIIALKIRGTGGVGLGPGFVRVLDLDGNTLNAEGDLEITYDTLPDGTTSSDDNLRGFDIGFNTIIAGSRFNGDIWKWNFNSRITPFDLKRINKPKSYE